MRRSIIRLASQIGLGASVYGFDRSIAYVDTNLDSPNCGNTMNCDARAIFTVSKTFSKERKFF